MGAQGGTEVSLNEILACFCICFGLLSLEEIALICLSTQSCASFMRRIRKAILRFIGLDKDKEND